MKKKVNLPKDIDSIVLDYNQLKKISKWVREREFDSVEVPFDEVNIIIKGLGEMFNLTIDMGAYFQLIDDKIVIEQYSVDNNETMFTMTIDESYFKDGKIDIESNINNPLGDKYFQKLSASLLLSVLDIFQYITNRDKYVSYKESRVRINKKARSGSNRKNKRSSNRYVHRKVKVYEILDKPQSPQVRNKYTHSWRVRGHWRYYKNTGKRVWVNSYIKGKGDLKGSQYIIK